MKSTLVLFSVLSILATGTEAVNFLKYLLCGGHGDVQVAQQQLKCKEIQVMPSANHDDDVETRDCTPTNSDRLTIHLKCRDDDERNSAFEGKVLTKNEAARKNSLKSKRIVPGEHEFEKDQLHEPLNKDSIDKSHDEEYYESESGSDYDEDVISFTHDLKTLLDGNGVHIKDLEISEAGASELLKIKIPLIILLSPKKRSEFLYSELEDLDRIRVTENSSRHIPNRSRNRPIKRRRRNSPIEKFNRDVSKRLSEVKTLKDFLVVVIKFYKKCYTKFILNDCIRAIIAANVFDIDELPKAFKTNYSSLFDFACENGFDSLALQLVERIPNQRVNLKEAAINAFNNGNYDLSEELLEILREKYGDDQNLHFNIAN